jgi:hypothetical protein
MERGGFPRRRGRHRSGRRGVAPVFWSASVDDFDARQAYAVMFVGENPSAVPGARVFPENFKLRAWCVRGGPGEHP